MKTASFFSLLKQNGHVLLSLSGIGCLVLSLFLIASSNSESDRRYNEILDQLAEMKKGGGSMNADIALTHEGLKGKLRKKRGDTESENRTRSKGGAVYIRWGRKTCPWNGTELVYQAFISSSKSERDRRYTQILNHLATLKEGGGSLNISVAALHREGSKSRLRQKRDVVEQQVSKRSSRSNGGALHIRWGRKSCPEDGTELVYQGIAAGSWYGHSGAASNHQCLPNNPVWGRYTDKAGAAFMYGMEFQETLDGLMDTSNVQKPLTNHNVPCAVCRSKKRITCLMVPAMYDCFNGWHLEYHGYLMAGSHGSSAGTQYICVDEAPEVDQAGYRDENGAMLYRVTGQCGSLPCPEYVQNRELACAVCTK